MPRTLGPVDVVTPAVAQGGIAMAPSSLTRRTLAFAAAFLMLTLLALPAFAQEKEEEAVLGQGRPKGDVPAKMAPVAAFPVPTPADKLPKAQGARRASRSRCTRAAFSTRAACAGATRARCS